MRTRFSYLERVLLPTIRQHNGQRISAEMLSAELAATGHDYDPSAVRQALNRLVLRQQIIREPGRGCIPARYHLEMD